MGLPLLWEAHSTGVKTNPQAGWIASFENSLGNKKELDPMTRWLTWTVYATPLMTLTTDLGLSIRVSMFEYGKLVTGTSS